MKYIDYDKVAEEAAERYPIGTKYIPLYEDGAKNLNNTGESLYSPGWVTQKSGGRKGWEDSNDCLDVGSGYVYVNGIWAERVEYPENYKHLKEPSYEIYRIN